MEDEIYKILESVPNVYCGWYQEDVTETHVTFLIYKQFPDNFSNCDNESINNAVQVDVWGTDIDEVKNTEKTVKGLLKDNDFIWSESDRDFETDTKLYHFANRFNYMADADS